MRERIRDRLLGHLRDQGHAVDVDTNLIESEVIDSIGILELVAMLESELGHELDGDIVRAETFGTISSILRALEEHGLIRP